MITFNSLNISIDPPKYKDINVCGVPIQVKQFVSVKDKFDLVMITLQDSILDHIVNDMLVNINFHVNLVKMYTNINFVEKDLEDTFSLYDKLNMLGIIDAVIAAMPAKDYSALVDDMNVLKDSYSAYAHSVVALLSQMPQNIVAVQNAIKDFDPNEFKQIVDLAKAVK